MLSCFSLNAIDAMGTIYLILVWLVCTLPLLLSGLLQDVRILWSVSNLFLSDNVYLLYILLLESESNLYSKDLPAWYFCVGSSDFLLRRFSDQRILFQKKNMPRSSKWNLSNFWSWVYNLDMFLNYFRGCRSIFSFLFFLI